MRVIRAEFPVQSLESHAIYYVDKQWRSQEFCSGEGGRFQQIQLRTEDRENGDLGAVAP